MASMETKTEHELNVQKWQQEKDFFTRWSLYPPIPELLDLIEAYDPKSFIDMGCGGASYLKILCEKGLRIFGCDINPQAIAIQQTQLPPHRLFQGDLFALHPNESFDVGLIHGVLYYYTHEEKVEFLSRRAPGFINKAIVLEEHHYDQPRQMTDYRGIMLHFENWIELAKELPGWNVKILEKKDPNFLARYIQRFIPTYKISETTQDSKWILLEKKA